MSAVPYPVRCSPDCSNSTMRCPNSQYAAVMAAFTGRAADSLAASMIFEASPKTTAYGASWSPNAATLFTLYSSTFTRRRTGLRLPGATKPRTER